VSHGDLALFQVLSILQSGWLEGECTALLKPSKHDSHYYSSWVRGAFMKKYLVAPVGSLTSALQYQFVPRLNSGCSSLKRHNSRARLAK
jgi:hypothetical protein